MILDLYESSNGMRFVKYERNVDALIATFQ